MSDDLYRDWKTLAKQASPDLLDSLIPASKDRIDDLGQACRVTIPPEYEAFLQLMGTRTGTLRLGGMNLDIGEAMDQNEIDDDEYDRSRYLRIGSDGRDQESPRHPFLDLRDYGPNGPAIVRFNPLQSSAEGPGFEASPSFHSILHMLSFYLYVDILMPNQAHRWDCMVDSPDASMEERVAPIRERLALMGFASPVRDSNWFFGGTGPGGRLVFATTVRSWDSIRLSVAGSSRNECLGTIETIADQFTVDIVRPA